MEETLDYLLENPEVAYMFSIILKRVSDLKKEVTSKNEISQSLYENLMSLQEKNDELEKQIKSSKVEAVIVEEKKEDKKENKKEEEK